MVVLTHRQQVKLRQVTFSSTVQYAFRQSIIHPTVLSCLYSFSPRYIQTHVSNSLLLIDMDIVVAIVVAIPRTLNCIVCCAYAKIVPYHTIPVPRSTLPIQYTDYKY